jgi:hypothetical protein
MIDATTYKLMHGDEEQADDREELDEDSMHADNLPGYGFHNKKWSKCLHQI